MSNAEIAAVLPDGWHRARGYAHAIAHTGRTIRVAGQMAVNAGKGPVAADMSMGAQFALALGNVVACVAAGGATADQIVNLRVYVTDMAAFHDAGADIGAAWAEHLGRHFPAMTVVEVSALYDAAALIEIEAEAVADGG